MVKKQKGGTTRLSCYQSAWRRRKKNSTSGLSDLSRSPNPNNLDLGLHFTSHSKQRVCLTLNAHRVSACTCSDRQQPLSHCQPARLAVCLSGVTVTDAVLNAAVARVLFVSKITILLYCKCAAVRDRKVQYSTVQYSTVQYSTVQCSTVQYSTVQYSTGQHSTVQYNTVQYSTVQCSTVQCSTVQYSTVQYSTVQQVL